MIDWIKEAREEKEAIIKSQKRALIEKKKLARLEKKKALAIKREAREKVFNALPLEKQEAIKNAREKARFMRIARIELNEYEAEMALLNEYMDNK